MGGRGSYSATYKRKQLVMSEQEFLNRKGVGSVLSENVDATLRLPHGETLRARERRLKQGEREMKAYGEKRSAARAEYRSLVESGKVRPPTNVESLMEVAHGHPDNSATQAARRALAKRGVDWISGGRLGG